MGCVEGPSEKERLDSPTLRATGGWGGGLPRSRCSLPRRSPRFVGLRPLPSCSQRLPSSLRSASSFGAHRQHSHHGPTRAPHSAVPHRPRRRAVRGRRTRLTRTATWRDRRHPSRPVPHHRTLACSVEGSGGRCAGWRTRSTTLLVLAAEGGVRRPRRERVSRVKTTTRTSRAARKAGSPRQWWWMMRPAERMTRGSSAQAQGADSTLVRKTTTKTTTRRRRRKSSSLLV